MHVDKTAQNKTNYLLSPLTSTTSSAPYVSAAFVIFCLQSKKLPPQRPFAGNIDYGADGERHVSSIKSSASDVLELTWGRRESGHSNKNTHINLTLGVSELCARHHLLFDIQGQQHLSVDL